MAVLVDTGSQSLALLALQEEDTTRLQQGLELVISFIDHHYTLFSGANHTIVEGLAQHYRPASRLEISELVNKYGGVTTTDTNRRFSGLVSV
jgi:hypothetical protein